MSKKESAAQNQRKEKTQGRAMDVAVRENGLLVIVDTGPIK
jgi:hypothetical protein